MGRQCTGARAPIATASLASMAADGGVLAVLGRRFVSRSVSGPVLTAFYRWGMQLRRCQHVIALSNALRESESPLFC
jgi:hypothetical protein